MTQSGSNALHGTIFEFLRNSALDARSYFAQGANPPFQQNQFGGAAGGPLKKDRIFLFGNYEGFRQALTLSNVAVVPDQQARQGFLPNSATGVYTKVANLNPAMLQYMSFWPQPNGAGVAGPTNGPTQRHGDFSSTVPSRTSARISAPCERTTIWDIEIRFRELTRSTMATAWCPWLIRYLHLTARSACRWPVCRKRTSSRRDVLNTFRAGFLTRRIQSRIHPCSPPFQRTSTL